MKQYIETLYSFNELSNVAKAKALNDLADLNTMEDWHAYIYADAANVSIKITAFNLDNRSIEGELEDGISETVRMILVEHGQDTDTYKLAKAYDTQWDALVTKHSDGVNVSQVAEENSHNFDMEADEMEATFTNAILDKYLSMLLEEYAYKSSDKAIIETIEANEYTFTAKGELKNVDAKEDTFVSYLETHFEVVSFFARVEDKHVDSVVNQVRDDNGSTGLYELAKDWTEEFQQLHEGREWDGEFIDEIEEFCARKNAVKPVPKVDTKEAQIEFLTAFVDEWDEASDEEQPALTDKLNAYLTANGLPIMAADELLAQLTITE